MKVSPVIGTALLFLWLTFFSLGEVRGAPGDEKDDARPLSLNGGGTTLPNGVAAGDTTQTSALLWTRATTGGDLLFEYSTDPAFDTAVISITATVSDLFQPVKVLLTGLSPATTYYYRVTDAAGAAGEGHFRTAAPIGTKTGLRFGVSGDWVGELAPYPAIANADERDLDFFVAHGDTIAAGSAPTTLADFRLKHNEVYSTHLGLNTWADLRSSTSILATIDDNEVRNDFAGGADPASDPRFDNSGAFINETQLYSTALQAFVEYNPISDTYYGPTGDARTANKHKRYRYRTYGSDAAVFLLDTRSFRDAQLSLGSTVTDVLAFLNNTLVLTDRTIFGAQQLSDLKADLLAAQAARITWKFVLVPSPIQNLGLYKAEDRFEGYAAERNDLLRFIHQNGIQNVVFIAAGLHGTVVNNLTYQDSLISPQIPVTTFEVIAGPVAVDPPSGPFGPILIEYAEALGVITPTTKAIYEALPRAGKDEFVRTLMDAYLITPLGYDPIGLDGSGVQATLLQGGYLAAHTYGWTEFEVSPATQVLTVTTYGIDYYTETLLLDDPAAVISRTPAIVSQFVVTPSLLPPVSPEIVTIDGPTTGDLATLYTFTATTGPISTTTPLTYAWQANGQSEVIHSNDLSDTAPFSWTTSGLKWITVTVQNEGEPVVSDTYTIDIIAPPIITAPQSISLSGPETGQVGAAYSFTATVGPPDTTTPLTYFWRASEQETVTQTNALEDDLSLFWLTPGSKTITVTAGNGGPAVTAVHTVTLIVSGVVTPVNNVMISGPVEGAVDVSYSFTATVSPADATLPVTYTWEASGYGPLSQTGGGSDSQSFSWPVGGQKTITVTADNGLAQVTDLHTITIEASEVITPLNNVTISGPVEGAVDVSYSFTATVSPADATLPVTYTWEASGYGPLTRTNTTGDSLSFAWPLSGLKTIIVTAHNGGAPVSDTHTIAITATDSGGPQIYLPLILKH